MPIESPVTTLAREYRRLKILAESALDQTTDAAFFAALAPEENSIAILVGHLSGNMHSRWSDFLTSDGEKPDRDRDSEFVLSDSDTRESLMRRWESGWRLLFEAIDPLVAADLEREVTIRGESLTVLQAALRQLTHYASHIGQIVLLAKHHAGPSWKTLSVPRGQSEEYNRKPPAYL
ncbi:MAG: DUF1572 domain-containing protein [Acidobacteria bacterium]|nr:DUF1572 domain-containing protein [Acidobacteriota bacterium]